MSGLVEMRVKVFGACALSTVRRVSSAPSAPDAVPLRLMMNVRDLRPLSVERSREAKEVYRQ